jgi:hypothetical protein
MTPLAPKLGRDASLHGQLGDTAGGKDRRELGGHEQQVAALNIDLNRTKGSPLSLAPCRVILM